MTPPLQRTIFEEAWSERCATETSTHLESTSASQRGAAATLLDQSKLRGSAVGKASTCKGLVAVSSSETRTRLESNSASQRGAAATLLDQSKLRGGAVRKANTCKGLVAVSSSETRTHLESASTSLEGAAASSLDQSKLQWRLRCQSQQKLASA